jgi:hypothetical protein
MNAYELADELENYVWMNPNNNRDYCKEVKDMIRQQADRIADHEKTFNEMCELYEKQLDKQADRIAELEKECNWAKDQWNKDRICFEARKTELEKDLALKNRDRDVFREFTLAYEKRIAELEKSQMAWYEAGKFVTPQIKELDKSDIYAEALQAGIMLSTQYGQAENKLMPVSDGDTLVKFARAILKKASEK